MRLKGYGLEAMTEKTPVDLAREVDMELAPEGCAQDERFDVIGDLWYGPPGVASYYVAEIGGPSIGIMFGCPGCGELSSCRFRPSSEQHAWAWDGNREKPTLSPSIHANPEKGGCGWHGFLVRGRFQLNP